MASSFPLEPGMLIEIKCAGCHRWIPWEVPEFWWEYVPSFHSRGCANRKRLSWRNIEEYSGCPRPDKRAYRSNVEAQEVVKRMCLETNEPFSIYRCRCGALYVGRRQVRLLSPDATSVDP